MKQEEEEEEEIGARQKKKQQRETERTRDLHHRLEKGEGNDEERLNEQKLESNHDQFTKDIEFRGSEASRRRERREADSNNGTAKEQKSLHASSTAKTMHSGKRTRILDDWTTKEIFVFLSLVVFSLFNMKVFAVLLLFFCFCRFAFAVRTNWVSSRV